MTKQPKYKQYFLCRLFFCPLRRNFRRKLDSLCRRWQQLYNMGDNEDKTWVTTTIQPGWSAKNGKKNLWPCQFFLWQQQFTLRQSEVESQQPPPKNPQNLRNRPGDNPPAGLVAPHLVQLVDLSLLAALLQEEDHPRCALDPKVSPITGAALFLH